MKDVVRYHVCGACDVNAGAGQRSVRVDVIRTPACMGARSPSPKVVLQQFLDPR
jgi:hypothetical protein